MAIPRSADKEQSAEGFDRCRMYAVNLTEMWNNGIKEGNPSWPTVSCRNGWVFNYSDIPYSTIASEV